MAPESMSPEAWIRPASQRSPVISISIHRFPGKQNHGAASLQMLSVYGLAVDVLLSGLISRRDTTTCKGLRIASMKLSEWHRLSFLEDMVFSIVR